MPKLYLQNIIKDISFENLSAKWPGFSAKGGSASGGEDGTKINIKDLDYKLIKPLIWWE